MDEFSLDYNFEGYTYLKDYAKPLKAPERKMEGREAELNALQAVLMRPELSNVILLADAGSGKALADDTLIPVNDDRGFVPICDIVPGDEVFDENGVPTSVLGVYPQGDLRAYKVTFQDGTCVICNDEHIWTARTSRQKANNAKYMERTLSEMMSYEHTFKFLNETDIDTEAPVWYIPSARPVNMLRRDIDFPLNMFGYIMDAIDIEDGESFIDDIFRDFNIDRKYRHYFSSDLNERRIPVDFFTGSSMQKLELMRGLMEVSGGISVNKGSIDSYYLTNSYSLAYDVISLCNSLGCRAVINASHNPKYLYKVDVTGPLTYRMQMSHALMSYLNSLADIKGIKSVLELIYPRTDVELYSDLGIVSIEKLNLFVPMTCIYVDSPHHLFLCTENYIVTHNTALVQKCMVEDPLNRIYLEVDVAKLASGNINDMPSRVKGLFDEVYAYRMSSNSDREIVLFMDEFHQIVQLSDAAVEALKPMLADSGTRGIKVIAATTYKEFEMYVQSNQPLVERLYRLNLKQLGKDVVIKILRGMAEVYGVADQFYDDLLFEQIYEYTELYIPASSQPRKSILMLDAMIGYHRAHNSPLNMDLLATIVSESQGVNVAFKVDATKIKETLDSKVFSQELASEMIARRLHIAVADLHDTSRTMSSFLFTGSTGTGKGTTGDTIVPVYPTESNNYRYYKRANELEVGDLVFSRKGQPEEVTGVFPQGMKDIYRVKLSDGRQLDVDSSHLWGVYRDSKNGEVDLNSYSVINTESLYDEYQKEDSDQNFVTTYAIPKAHPIRLPKLEYKMDPYLFTYGLLSEINVDHLTDYDFSLEDKIRILHRRLPTVYKVGSEKQRWDIVRAFMDYLETSQVKFDKDEQTLKIRIDEQTDLCDYKSDYEGLIFDLREILFSLGISSDVEEIYDRVENTIGCIFTISTDGYDYREFFTTISDMDILKSTDADGYRNNFKSEGVDIISITKLDEQQETFCIYVDDDEHLYQAENNIVTHNTEMTKSLAEILFDDRHSLIRFDMTEYSNPETLERFREELCMRVWERPFSIVLLDEIEKAAPEVTRLLLQVLDDARLMDSHSREVSFKNTYIILTTNAASEVYKEIAAYLDDEKEEMSGKKISGMTNQFSRYRKLIRRALIETGDNQFPPELYNRIDEVIPFAPLNRNTLEKITIVKLKDLQKQVHKKHNIKVSFSVDVPFYLLYEDADVGTDAGGARGVVRKLTTDITSEVAKVINEYPGVTHLYVDVVGDMVYKNKNIRQSKASIVVKNSHEAYYERTNSEFFSFYKDRLGLSTL